MPLIQSGSQKARKANISVLMKEVGKSPHVGSRAQALAIALDIQRRNRRASGGVVRRDTGGAVQDVIAALSQGSGAAGGMGPPAAPTTAPTMTGVTPVTSTGVAPPPTATMGAPATNPASPTNPAPVGVAQNTAPVVPAVAQPVNNPIQKPLMARGGALHRAAGGFSMATGPHLSPPWQQKNEIRGMMTGPILSTVPGRTDRHVGHVASGSYIIPADIISGRGQGNTLAGMQNMQHLFRMGPYGSSPMGMTRGTGAPRPPKPTGQMHSGGGKGGNSHIGTPTPVILAGGEFSVPPEKLMEVVHPNLSESHRIMDAWVLHERKKLRKTLAKLPGPAKD